MWSSHALGVVRDVRIVTRRCLVRSALVPRTSSLETEQTDIKVYLIPTLSAALLIMNARWCEWRGISEPSAWGWAP